MEEQLLQAKKVGSCGRITLREELRAHLIQLYYMSQPSLKKNFVWAFVGNVVSTFCMWLLLMLLTKLATAETVGVFAIAQAVGMPITMLLSMRLQIVQVTDARNDFDFGYYYALRIITSIAALVIICIVSFTLYPSDTALVISILGVGYAILALREVFLAVMQKTEQMGKMAVSRVMQGFLSLLMFGGLFWVTKNIVLSIVGLIIARLAVLSLYDIPVAKGLLVAGGFGQEAGEKGAAPLWHKGKLWKLAKLTSPLGLIAWLAILFTSIPRLILDQYTGRKEVGYFAAMSSLLVVGNVLMTALAQVVMPRMAKYYVENRRAYKLLLGKFTGASLLVGIMGVIVGVLFGKQILTLMFTSEYAEHSRVFIQLMVGGGIMLLFSCMNVGLTVARKFTVQVPVYIAAVGACGISAFFLIPRYGMFGAAWSLLICYTIGFAGCLFFVVLDVRES